MTRAAELPPLHMRRDGLEPTSALREIRENTGVRTVTNSFGMQVYLITRHDDIKAVLSDHERFSNSRPPGFVLPGGADEGPLRQPARPRSARTPAAAPDAHP